MTVALEMFAIAPARGTPALSEDSGDPYLADLAWFPLDDLPDSFRPLALRTLLQEAGSVAALAVVPVAAWG